MNHPPFLRFLLLGITWSLPGLPAAHTAESASAEPTQVTLSEDDFREVQAHREQTVELSADGKLVVTLGSNPTTGYTWKVSPQGQEPAILKQTGHQAIPAKRDLEGTGGSEVWTFAVTGKGSATLVFSYSRPWEGGEKGTWTLTVNARVKEPASQAQSATRIG